MLVCHSEFPVSQGLNVRFGEGSGMITMRSNSAAPRKAHKPPPPVPPRPSKTLVQEALAKSRQGHEHLVVSDLSAIQNKAKSPIRQAPPPPVNRPQITELNKSFSSGQVNVVLKKQAPQPVTSPTYYERSISVDKVSSRPVVYQSDNSKKQLTSTEATISSDIKRIESFKQNKLDVVKRSESFKKNDSDVRRQSITDIRRTGSIKKESCEVPKKHSSELRRVESFKKDHKPIVTVKKNPSLKRTDSKRVENIERVLVEKTSDLEKTEVDLDERKILIETNDDVKSRTSTLESGISSKMSDSCGSSNSSKSNSLEKKWDKMLNDRNHVNTLIDEMFASVLEVSSGASSNRSSSSESIIKDTNDNKIIISNKIEDNVIVNKSSSGDNLTVIVISDDSSSCATDENKSQSSGTKSNTSTTERKVKFNDRMNHELLINELQNMKNDQENILKRQRLPSVNLYENDNVTVNGDDKIHTNDWYGVNEGKEVKMSSCHITIENAYKDSEQIGLDLERINKMSHLHGLPPLPKSLSGFNFMENYQSQRQTPPTPIRSSSIRSNQGPLLTPTHHSSTVYSPQARTDGVPSKKISKLDTQLAILRREMYSLRQQDLSLLSQLWSLNESIQDFRQILQDQEDRVLSPPSPSPTPSSADEEEFYLSSTSIGYRPPSSIIGRKLSGSSAASGSVG